MAEIERIVMIPQDPVILYSYINTMLRDKYPSLKEFCETNISVVTVADSL